MKIGLPHIHSIAEKSGDLHHVLSRHNLPIYSFIG
jgi:hypothetical protein